MRDRVRHAPEHALQSAHATIPDDDQVHVVLLGESDDLWSALIAASLGASVGNPP